MPIASLKMQSMVSLVKSAVLSLPRQISLMPAYGIPFVGPDWILVGLLQKFLPECSSLSSEPDCLECMYCACAPSLSHVFSRESILEKWFFYFLRVNDTAKFQ